MKDSTYEILQKQGYKGSQDDQAMGLILNGVLTAMLAPLVLKLMGI